MKENKEEKPDNRANSGRANPFFKLDLRMLCIFTSFYAVLTFDIQPSLQFCALYRRGIFVLNRISWIVLIGKSETNK